MRKIRIKIWKFKFWKNYNRRGIDDMSSMNIRINMTINGTKSIKKGK